MSGEQTLIIRPAAVLGEQAAAKVHNALEERDVSRGGVWNVGSGVWQRYDVPWNGTNGMVGTARLMGTIGVVYGSPSRYEITIFRATVTSAGVESGWTVESLCDDALAWANLTLAACPRASMTQPPVTDPFRGGFDRGPGR